MVNSMNERMKQWIADHPDASVADAFKAGWFACTEAWCHGKREKMDQVAVLMREIIG